MLVKWAILKFYKTFIDRNCSIQIFYQTNITQITNPCANTNLTACPTNTTTAQTIYPQPLNNSNNSNYSYLYSNATTPILLTSLPKRGGTGGGTLITITGRNFPIIPSLILVSIAGIQCNVTSISVEQIQCRTDSYSMLV